MSVARRLRDTDLYDVDEVDSGEEVIAAIRYNSYDLLIIDHRMGQVSGLNVLQWMLEQKMSIPVIMVTGAGTETIAVEAMKLGAYDYIQKEAFELNHFPALVRATLERHSFKMERQQCERHPEEAGPSHEPPNLSRDAGMFFSDSADAAFHLIADGFSEYRKRIRPNLNPSVRSELDRIMMNAEEQLKMVSLLTAVLSDVTELASDPRISKLINEVTVQGKRGEEKESRDIASKIRPRSD